MRRGGRKYVKWESSGWGRKRRRINKNGDQYLPKGMMFGREEMSERRGLKGKQENQ